MNLSVLKLDRLWWPVCFVIFIVKLVFVAGFDMTAFGGGHDDYWFVQRALDWYWFGSHYDHMLLIKEPLWPLLMACLQYTFIPLRIWLEIFLSIVALTAARSCLPKERPFASLLCFSLIYLHPLSVPTFERSTSDALFSFLYLAILISFFRAVCVVRWSSQVVWAIVGGCLGGLLTIARGDGFVIVFAAMAAFFLVPTITNIKLSGSFLKSLILAFTVWLACFATTFPFRLANYRVFGMWSVSEQNEPNYEKAIKALAAIKTKQVTPHTSISRRAMRRAARVSKAMQAILPCLEGDVGKFWSSLSLGHAQLPGEFNSGFVHWAIRDCVASAGHYRTPEDARVFYRSLALDVEKAFLSGKLKKRFVLHPIIGVVPDFSELWISFLRLSKAILVPSLFVPVGEWWDPQIQSQYDRLANRRLNFIEKEVTQSEYLIELIQPKDFFIKSVLFSNPNYSITGKVLEQTGRAKISIILPSQLSGQVVISSQSDGTFVIEKRDSQLLADSIYALQYSMNGLKNDSLSWLVVDNFLAIYWIWFVLWGLYILRLLIVFLRHRKVKLSYFLLSGGLLIIIAGRFVMMMLIDSQSFFMIDWRYIFPISLVVAYLPFALGAFREPSQKVLSE